MTYFNLNEKMVRSKKRDSCRAAAVNQGKEQDSTASQLSIQATVIVLTTATARELLCIQKPAQIRYQCHRKGSNHLQGPRSSPEGGAGSLSAIYFGL